MIPCDLDELEAMLRLSRTRRPSRAALRIDLEDGATEGLLLEPAARTPRAALDEALTVASSREARARGAVCVALRGDAGACVAAVLAAEPRVKELGLDRSLTLGLRCDAPDDAAFLAERAAAVGLRVAWIAGAGRSLRLLARAAWRPLSHVVVEAEPADFVEPHRRADLLELGRACRRARVSLEIAGVARFDDLVFALQLGARAASGPAFGGAGPELPRASGLHRRLVRLARGRVCSDALEDAGCAEALVDLVRRLERTPSAELPAVRARRLLERVVRSEERRRRADGLAGRAAEMLVRAEAELDSVLASVAEGRAPRAERIERCEGSYEEASALWSLACGERDRARAEATLALASAELQRATLTGALAAPRPEERAA